jgi:hypothetical protein
LSIDKAKFSANSKTSTANYCNTTARYTGNGLNDIIFLDQSQLIAWVFSGKSIINSSVQYRGCLCFSLSLKFSWQETIFFNEISVKFIQIWSKIYFWNWRLTDDGAARSSSSSTCRGFFTPKIVGTCYMQGYKVKEKTAIVPPVSKLSGHPDHDKSGLCQCIVVYNPISHMAECRM